MPKPRAPVAAAIFELVHRLHQADVALLDQVERVQPTIATFLGDGHHEAQVGLDELVFGSFRFHLALCDFLLSALLLLEANLGIAFQPFQVAATPPLLAVAEAEVADDERNSNDLAAEAESAAAVFPCSLFCHYGC